MEQNVVQHCSVDKSCRLYVKAGFNIELHGIHESVLKKLTLVKEGFAEYGLKNSSAPMLGGPLRY